jgi:hypothetical protein
MPLTRWMLNMPKYDSNINNKNINGRIWGDESRINDTVNGTLTIIIMCH